MPANRSIPKPTAPAAATLKTVREIAAEDQVSEKTVRRAIKAGLLEAIRVGPGRRLMRISPAAHAAYRRTLNG